MSLLSPLAGLQVHDLSEFRGLERSRLLDALARIYHAHWRGGTLGYQSESAARRYLEARLESDRAATFVALTPRGDLTGTAAIGTDDFYDGFCRANGLWACWVGRDLFTVPHARGVSLNGLKVWQHLLEARLGWLQANGQSTMAVFTEPGLRDLAALYERLGAVVTRRGLDHRHLGCRSITMLEYPVQKSLAVLASMRARARDDARDECLPMRPLAPHRRHAPRGAVGLAG